MAKDNSDSSLLDGMLERTPSWTGNWATIRMDIPVDGMHFWPDGTVTIDGSDLGPGMMISNCNFGGRLITKSRGESIELSISQGEETLKYRFEDGRWYKWETAPQSSGTNGWKERLLHWFESPGLRDFDRWAQRLRATSGKYWKRTGLAVVVVVALMFAMHRWRTLAADEPLRLLEQRTAEIRDLKATLSKEENDLSSAEANVKARMAAIQEQLAALRAQESEVQAAEREKAEAALARDQQISLYRSAFQELEREGELLLEQHDALLAEMQQWEAAIPPLLTNELGRHLASDEAHVRTFLQIREQPRTSSSAAKSLRRELEELLRPIRRSAQREDLAAGPLEEVRAALHMKGEQIARIEKEYREPRELLLSLAAKSPLGDATLQMAIDALAAQDAEQRAHLILEQTRDEQQRLDQVAALAEEQELQAEAESQEAARAADEETKAEELAHARAVAKAKRREVRTALAFFTAQAYSQPFTDGANTGLVMTGEKGPISLSRLHQVNALEPSDPASLTKLLYVLRSPIDADRHPWPFTQSVDLLSARKQDELRKIQSYLNELGPVLVELELLAE